MKAAVILPFQNGREVSVQEFCNHSVSLYFSSAGTVNFIGFYQNQSICSQSGYSKNDSVSY